MSKRLFLAVITLVFGVHSASLLGVERTALFTAYNSIKQEDLKDHVFTLASDLYEGRAAGSSGGRAAAGYLRDFLIKNKLKPLGEDGSFYQPFNGNCRNVLAYIEGSDPVLKNEYILVGAHYDHVGYGKPQNSYGPFGYIHNGADDNASGVSTSLELLEALAMLPNGFKRSVIFAFWDCEEAGLVGSDFWVENPTVNLKSVKLKINLDMVGRLRKNRLEVYGTRSTFGMRELVAYHNHAGPQMDLDFTWEMKQNSDHYSFYKKNIPVLMFHTGLHKDYHRPSDDAETINVEGMQKITHLLFGVVHNLCEGEVTPIFRHMSKNESLTSQREIEAPLTRLPSRFGVTWEPMADTPEGVLLTRVFQESAANRAGLQAGDRILSMNGQAVNNDNFAPTVWASQNPVKLSFIKKGEDEAKEISIELEGQPIRIGITWRADSAEQGSVYITRVVPGSAAAKAGIRHNDRIRLVNGETFTSSESFRDLLLSNGAAVKLDVERRGIFSSMDLKLVSTTKQPIEVVTKKVPIILPESEESQEDQPQEQP